MLRPKYILHRQNAQRAALRAAGQAKSCNSASRDGGTGGWQGAMMAPPKNLSGRAKVCFAPQTFNHDPPKLVGTVVKIFAKLLLSIHAKFSKFFACGGLVKVELIPLVILGYEAEDLDQFLVGLQPTVIASRAPHLLLDSKNRGRASPVKSISFALPCYIP